MKKFVIKKGARIIKEFVLTEKYENCLPVDVTNDGNGEIMTYLEEHQKRQSFNALIRCALIAYHSIFYENDNPFDPMEEC